MSDGELRSLEALQVDQATMRDRGRYVELRSLEAALGRLRDDQTLTHLKVGGYHRPFGVEGARAIAEALKSSDKLRGLDLEYNKIGADGARAIADALKVNKTLEELNLTHNFLRTDGARAIADALEANGRLRELNLGYNDIGAEGARAIAEALKANEMLRELNLWYNKIGAEGARAIADALAANGTLEKLSLGWNEFGTEGAHPIADALRKNETLKELDLGKNVISDEGAHAFAGAFRVNNALADLWWEENDGAPIIEKMRQHKKEFEEKRTSFYFDVDDGSVSGIKGTVWEAATDYGHELFFVHEALKDILNEANKKAIKELLDGARSPNGSPLLHLAADFDSAEASEFCKFLVVEVGADFDTIADKLGRTVREIAMGNGRATQWARSVGTFLGRYRIERKGLYKSATCEVHFAVDVQKTKNDEDRNVAIKIMNNEKQFKHELEHRLGKNQKYATSGGCIDPDWNLFDAGHAVPLLRYHEEEYKEELHRCLVMQQGERNLDEIIRYEGIAGRDINAITFFAVDLAKALQHLHEKRVIHGDVKPRNIVRIHGDYKLIDFDASVGIGEPLTEKFSSGYLAPEIAQVKFRPDENLEDLQARLEKLEEEIGQARASGDKTTRRMKEAEYQKAEDEIDLIKSSDVFGGIEQAKVTGDRKTKRRKVDEHRKVEGAIDPIESSEVSACRESKCSADEKVDVWSYGVVLYEMLTGKSLFRRDNNDNLESGEEECKLANWGGIAQGLLDEVLTNCNDDGDLLLSAKDLLSKCLSPEGSRIATFNLVLKHPFLKRKQLQLQDLKEGQEHLRKEIKHTVDRMDKKLGVLEGKINDTIITLSDIQDQLKIVLTSVSNILLDRDAPKLMCVVPVDSDWWDWDLNKLVEKTVKIVMICPVSFSAPRNDKNELMGYTGKLPRDWVKKYGPALKISLDVLKIAFAAAPLVIPGCPTLPNLTGVGKSTNVFKVMNDTLKKSEGEDAPDLKELEKALGDKLNLKVPENTSSIPEETMKLIRESYKEVQDLAKINQDERFNKTGLVKVEKEGEVEYVLDDPMIKSLYEEKGQACVGLTAHERIQVGADIDAITKVGWLRKVCNKKTDRKPEIFCVLRKNGLFTHYKSKKEYDEDLLGLRGTSSNKVESFSFGKLCNKDTDKGNFYVNYIDGSSEMYRGTKEEKEGLVILSPRDSARAWVLEAWKIFSKPPM